MLSSAAALLDGRFERPAFQGPAKFQLMPRVKQTKASSSRGVFVTGTDTGVGKTVVTAALAVALRTHGYGVGVMKPIETGVLSSTDTRSDAVRLHAAAGSGDALSVMRPYVFRLPLAPVDAARLEKITIAMPTIARAFRTLRSRHDMLLVEGVGGVFVPITPLLKVSDLIYRMKLPAIVVGRASLGGINHTLLTLEALRQRKISVLALVLNRTLPTQTVTAQQQEGSTQRLLRQLVDIPVIGPLPYHPTLERNFQSEVARLARTTAIRNLMKLVLASDRGTISRRG